MTSKRKEKPNEEYSEDEAACRRDAVIKHMLSTPPKPHSEMRLGKRKGNRAFRRTPKST
jgi:hypothetical protein